MPAYKDERILKSGKKKVSWISRFYCNGKQIKKRGFKTRKEAIEFETNYINEHSGSPSMLLKEFVKVFYNDNKENWKESSLYSNKSKINLWIIPFLGNMPLDEITYQDIKKWHKVLNDNNLGDTYKNKINKILSSIFNHAIKFYGLKENPCLKAGSIGSTKRNEINFWTLEEYKEFISHIDKPQYKIAFETLYQTGMRIGELKALTLNDIDFSIPQIKVTKTFHKRNGKIYITEPKTFSSKRNITISRKLANEILEFTNHYYDFKEDEFIFKLAEQTYLRELKKVCEEYNIKPIRLHDLRHSHASFLINRGKNILMVAERLGHSSIKETLDTYSHLYPSQQLELINEFEEIF